MNLKDEKILSAFEEKQSITGVHKITGYNWQQIAKVLSTYGIVANDKAVEQNDASKRAVENQFKGGADGRSRHMELLQMILMKLF